MNSKLQITQFYDSLVNQIDIFIERQLEICQAGDIIYRIYRFEPKNQTFETHNHRQLLFEWDFEVVDYDGLRNWCKTSFEKLSSKFDIDSNLCSRDQKFKELIKASDYLNHIRDEMLAELANVQRQTFERYELLRTASRCSGFGSSSGDDVNRLKNQSSMEKFCFLLQTRSDEKQILFKSTLHLVICDFYLNKKQRDLFENRAKNRFIFTYGAQLDYQGRHNILLLHDHYIVYWLHSYLDKLFSKGITVKPVIRITKQNLFGTIKPSFRDENTTFLPNTDLKSDDFSESTSQVFSQTRCLNMINFNGFLLNGEKLPASLQCLKLNSTKLSNKFFLNLSQLRCLVFDNCNLIDPPIDTFKSLVNLEVLLLTNSPINWSNISFHDLHKLKGLGLFFSCTTLPTKISLPQLELLELQHYCQNSDSWLNPVDLIKELNMPSLKGFKLSVNFNFILLDLDMFEVFSNLKSLEITCCEFEMLSLGHRCRASNLQSLRLQYNKLKSIEQSFCEKLPNLRSLEISSNELEYKPGMFQGLEHLELLNLSFNQFSSPLVGGIFKGLGNLKRIDLQNNKLTEIDKEVFSDLKNLEYLNLSYNMLSRLNADIFATMPNLIELNLSSNDIELQDGLFAKLTGLKILNLSYCNIGFKLRIGIFSDLKNLESLIIHNNLISHINRDMLKGLVSLKLIDFAYNQIDRVAKDAFAETECLAAVGLQFTGVTSKMKNELQTSYPHINFSF